MPGGSCGGQPGVGLVGELAQRRGVDAAAVLLQREERVVGLAGVGRAEVEDDVLGPRRADGQLGLGAVHPALLGELLDAGRRAVVVAGRGARGRRVRVRLRRRSGYCGGTVTGENRAFGRRKSGRVRSSAGDASCRGPYGGQQRRTRRTCPGSGRTRHVTPPGPRRAAAPRCTRPRIATTSSSVRGATSSGPSRGPVGHGHRADAPRPRARRRGTAGPHRQHAVGHGGPAGRRPWDGGEQREVAEQAGRRCGRTSRCAPVRGQGVDGWTTTTRMPRAVSRRAALHTCRDCRRRTEPAAVRAARARGPARVSE